MITKRNVINTQKVVTTESESSKRTKKSNSILNEYDPYIRLEFSGNIINSQIARSASSVDASNTVQHRILTLSTGISAFSNTVVTHRQVLKAGDYLMRFHARWPNGPQILLKQTVDYGNFGNSVGFGYPGIPTTGTFDFAQAYELSGTLQTGGVPAIHLLTITAAASGVETATVTVNSIPFTIPLTDAGGSLAFTAFEIALYGLFGVYFIRANNIEDTVNFIFGFPGLTPGTFSFSSTGTATGTFTALNPGGDIVQTTIPRSKWNGTSTAILNPAEWNEFYIHKRDISDEIEWGIFNRLTREYELLHTFIGRDNQLLWTDPDFFLQPVAINFDDTGSLVTASSYQVSQLFVDVRNTGGGTELFRPNFQHEGIKTLAANVVTSLLIIKNLSTLQDTVTSVAALLEFISFSVDGVKPVQIKISRAVSTLDILPTVPSTTNFPEYHIDDIESVMIVDINMVQVDLSNTTTLLTISASKLDSGLIELKNKNFTLTTLESLVVSAVSTAASMVEIALSWTEFQ